MKIKAFLLLGSLSLLIMSCIAVLPASAGHGHVINHEVKATFFEDDIKVTLQVNSDGDSGQFLSDGVSIEKRDGDIHEAFDNNPVGAIHLVQRIKEEAKNSGMTILPVANEEEIFSRLMSENDDSFYIAFTPDEDVPPELSSIDTTMSLEDGTVSPAKVFFGDGIALYVLDIEGWLPKIHLASQDAAIKIILDNRFAEASANVFCFVDTCRSSGYAVDFTRTDANVQFEIFAHVLPAASGLDIPIPSIAGIDISKLDIDLKSRPLQTIVMKIDLDPTDINNLVQLIYDQLS